MGQKKELSKEYWDYRYKIYDVILKADFDHYFNYNHFQYGLHFINHFNSQKVDIANENNINNDGKASGFYEMIAYFEDEISFSKKIKTTLGIHFNTSFVKIKNRIATTKTGGNI
ncbi:MAG: hypothetical protein HC905_28475 [Bacteroidales bacterium]|nr:hypothetical protein [Bacteroidales bacterium]